MKILCLFSKNYPENRQRRFIRSLQRHAVTITSQLLTNVDEIEKKDFDAFIIYGIQDTDSHYIKSIRERFPTQSILVISSLSRDARLLILETGADFYTGYQTTTQEILQIIFALHTLENSDFTGTEIQVRDLRISLIHQDVWRQDRRLSLSTKEYQLLRQLALSAGIIQTKDHLLAALWEDETQINENTLEVLIHRLRRKLDPSNQDSMIETIYGVGYRLE